MDRVKIVMPIKIKLNKEKIKKFRLGYRLYTLLIAVWIIVASFAVGITFMASNANFSDVEKIYSTFIAANEFCPPYKPINVQPLNHQQNLDTTVKLEVFIEDPNNDKMNVSFYDASNNILIGEKYGIESKSKVFISWSNLSFGKTYSWYVVAEDHEGATKSDMWQFTTNYKPNEPILLFPSNNAEGISASVDLKINVSDEDDTALDVVFYDASDDSIIKEITGIYNSVSCRWDNLEYSKTYHWYVKVSDQLSETKSNIWSFTTRNKPSFSRNIKDINNQMEENIANIPPISFFEAPTYANVTEKIIINASKSYDPDGVISFYHWDFGDGTNITEKNNTILYKYQKKGRYNITLTVEDDKGVSSSNTKTIQINPILEISNIIIKPSIQNINSAVNITFDVTNISMIHDVLINLTKPSNEKIQVSIKENKIKNSSRYYYNTTYNMEGNYTFFAKIIDIYNNTESSSMFYFYITNFSDGTETDAMITPNIEITNSSVNITINTTTIKNISEVVINLITPENISYNISMSQLNNSKIYYLNLTINHSGVYNFFILFIKTDNYTSLSKKYNFTINDVILIKNVSINSESYKVNESVNISALIEVSKIRDVSINITSPNNKTYIYSMRGENNTTLYYITINYNLSGMYTFFIFVRDIFNNSYISKKYSFILAK